MTAAASTKRRSIPARMDYETFASASRKSEVSAASKAVKARAQKFHLNCIYRKMKWILERSFNCGSAKLIEKMPTNEKMIKVSIVEDSRGTRESLTELLGRSAHLRCVGAHANGEEALRKIPEEIPDVV